ncbi:hypothetical protein LOTGIDRAFT_170698 [Lottia gigantea]|uniref:Uncharacterized protein n=1 Tax=Lottia gigantea TaxID=225164 RepID=V4B2W5_LOTGI|nr:hypothetical protein LOTGIDRAFT_170698 [Lottia gigantea]ESP04453.1 hypothetical protein LOTGIDRAFT_170698 [Lottia gigantea]
MSAVIARVNVTQKADAPVYKGGEHRERISPSLQLQKPHYNWSRDAVVPAQSKKKLQRSSQDTTRSLSTTKEDENSNIHGSHQEVQQQQIGQQKKKTVISTEVIKKSNHNILDERRGKQLPTPPQNHPKISTHRTQKPVKLQL